jgi:hypothetical protein
MKDRLKTIYPEREGQQKSADNLTNNVRVVLHIHYEAITAALPD